MGWHKRTRQSLCAVAIMPDRHAAWAVASRRLRMQSCCMWRSDRSVAARLDAKQKSQRRRHRDQACQFKQDHHRFPRLSFSFLSCWLWTVHLDTLAPGSGAKRTDGKRVGAPESARAVSFGNFWEAVSASNLHVGRTSGAYTAHSPRDSSLAGCRSVHR